LGFDEWLKIEKFSAKGGGGLIEPWMSEGFLGNCLLCDRRVAIAFWISLF
jgi:hypothetical protein